MKNQTAVEWFLNEIYMQFPNINNRWKQVMIEKALEMEKHQIIDAYIGGYSAPENRGDSETYYNETFKNI
jgi:hypothetical protein